jgi:DNA-directed RNA polymerase sigma subunit (sigma70/sigma32)
MDRHGLERLLETRPVLKSIVLSDEALGVLVALIEGLKQSERNALEKRFGLIDGEARTLRGAGADLGLSGTRISQLVDKGLRRLMWHAWSPNGRLRPFRRGMEGD